MAAAIHGSIVYHPSRPPKLLLQQCLWLRGFLSFFKLFFYRHSSLTVFTKSTIATTATIATFIIGDNARYHAICIKNRNTYQAVILYCLVQQFKKVLHKSRLARRLSGRQFRLVQNFRNC